MLLQASVMAMLSNAGLLAKLGLSGEVPVHRLHQYIIMLPLLAGAARQVTENMEEFSRITAPKVRWLLRFPFNKQSRLLSQCQ